MDIWERLYLKAKEQYHPEDVSPFVYAHHVVCALEAENGDIFTGKDAKDMLEQTGADSVMIGRGAMGNPFIFEEIKCYFDKKSYTPPSIFEKINVSRRHLSMLVSEKGEDVAVREARKHIAWYLKGERGSAFVRNEVNSATSLDRLEEILSSYEKMLKGE